MKVKFGEKSGRKNNFLSEEEQQWVLNFSDRANISYTTPGRRENVYIGVFNKVKKYAQKRYLLWKIRDIFNIINVSKIMENIARLRPMDPNLERKLHSVNLTICSRKITNIFLIRRFLNGLVCASFVIMPRFLVNSMNKKKSFLNVAFPETVNNAYQFQH